VLGNAVEDISNEIANFSDEVYSLDDNLLGDFQVDLYAQALESLCNNIKPCVMVIGHTVDNLDLAPRLAYRLGTELITDCIHLEIDPEGKYLLCTKPVYGENALATFTIEKKPLMATLRLGTMAEIGRCQARGKVIPLGLPIDRSVIKMESVERILGESVSLDKADAIVAGGRGIKRIEGLECLRGLIDVLKKYFSKVELGASRPLIDAGWLPHSRQLGSTGEKASPQLYIAIGISGASQHLSGVAGSKKIIAINKDGEAAIFDSADYGVVDEYEKIVPAFVEKLRGLS
jgi:electron transfer flavoprotein alpha subunit